MANAIRTARMLDGALLYARADKSDPFAYSRAVSHTLNGIASIDGDKDAFYSAEHFSEVRTLPSGEKYNAPGYRNITRP